MTISGTHQYHAFIPSDENTSKIHVKLFSKDVTSSQEVGIRSPDKLRLKDIHGYVTIAYEQNWWLGYIIEKNEVNDQIKVTFLHPVGPSPSFFYPRKSDILWISIKDVLCMVNPVTPTGRIYNLTENDVLQTINAFLSYSDQ